MTPLRAVTSFEKLKASPSTSALIELLQDIANGKTTLSDTDRDELHELCAREFRATHADVFAFTNDLWSALGLLRVRTPWLDVANQRLSTDTESDAVAEPQIDLARALGMPIHMDSSLKEMLYSDSSLMKLGYDWAKAESRRDALVQEAMNLTGDDLAFFAEVNLFFVEDAAFSHFRKTSQELSNLLLSLCVDSGQEQSEPPHALVDRDMEWLSLLVAAAYVSLLAAKHLSASGSEAAHTERYSATGQDSIRSDEAAGEDQAPNERAPDRHVAEAAAECVALCTVTLLTGIANYCVQTLKRDPLDMIGAAVQRVNLTGPMLQVFRDQSRYLGSNKARQFVEGLERLVPLIGMDRFVPAHGWECLLRAWIGDYPEELSHSDKDEPYLLVDPLLASMFSVPEEMRAHWDAEIFADGIDGSQVASHVRSRISPAPTVPFAVRFLRDIPTFRDAADCTEVLATWLCETVNQEASISGFAQQISFAASPKAFGLDAYVRKHSVYYSCLSTLALNLNGRERSYEEFDTGDANDAFLSAANTVRAAGYPEHATALLAYALIRLNFFVDDAPIRMSVSRLASFLALPDIQTHVARYIVPVFQIIRDQQSGLDIPTAVWIDSMIDQHKKPKAKLLRISPYGDEQIRAAEEPKELKLPAWFEGCNERLAVALRRTKKTVDKGRVEDNIWQADWSKGTIQDDFTVICKAIEAETKYLFRNFFDLSQSSGAFCDALMAASRSASLAPRGPLDWGWVEFFVRFCAYPQAPDRQEKSFAEAEQEADAYLAGLGRALRGLRTASELVPEIHFARELRNHYGGHTDSQSTRQQRGRDSCATQASVKWLFDYAMEGFGKLWELVRMQPERSL